MIPRSRFLIVNKFYSEERTKIIRLMGLPAVTISLMNSC